MYEYTYVQHTSISLRFPNMYYYYQNKQNENSTPRRDMTRARPRPPRAKSEDASKVKHDNEGLRAERWASSPANSFTRLAQDLVYKSLFEA